MSAPVRFKPCPPARVVISSAKTASGCPLNLHMATRFIAQADLAKGQLWPAMLLLKELLAGNPAMHKYT